MKVGERVFVSGPWCSFFGQYGEVVSLTPPVMVRLDGDDPKPLRIERSALVSMEEDKPPPWVAGD